MEQLGMRGGGADDEGEQDALGPLSGKGHTALGHCAPQPRPPRRAALRRLSRAFSAASRCAASDGAAAAVVPGAGPASRRCCRCRCCRCCHCGVRCCGGIPRAVFFAAGCEGSCRGPATASPPRRARRRAKDKLGMKRPRSDGRAGWFPAAVVCRCGARAPEQVRGGCRVRGPAGVGVAAGRTLMSTSFTLVLPHT
eukprot:353040-Chlamydomonas_euryale.AAC.4